MSAPRILIVTANFAPRGASPAIRTVHLAKYLHRAGCALEIVTYDERTLTLFSPRDAGLSAKVDAGVRVCRVTPGIIRRHVVSAASRDGSLGARKRALLRSRLLALAIPDPHMESIPAFLGAAKRCMRRFQPDVVLTHAYPFSMHIVGYLLASPKIGVSWIADYGDPWSGGGVEELARPTWRKRLDSLLERGILRRAAGVTVTTEATRQLYLRQYPEIESRLQTLPMGYDPDDFVNVRRLSWPGRPPGSLWIVHTGRLYGEARDAMPLISAVHQLVRDAPAVADRLRVSLVGDLEQRLKDAIADLSVSRVCEIVPWVPYEESNCWLVSADWLLLVGNKGNLQVPGKLYNYIGAGRPVLMLSESMTDPAASILATRPGHLVVPNRCEDIARALRSLLDGGSPRRIAAPGDLAWPAVVERLLNLLPHSSARDV
jgi:hypothetical protein